MLPDVCETELDIRLLPGMNHEEVIHQVKEIAGESIEITLIDWKPPVVTDPNSEFVSICKEALDQVTGVSNTPKGVSYYTDAAIFANKLNIPFVNIGPADTGMTHQPNENVEVSRLIDAVKTYILIALRYLS